MAAAVQRKAVAPMFAGAMGLETPVEGLYASTPEPLPFAPSLHIRAFLLQRARGNLLRIGEGEGEAPDHAHRLAAMIDQCLPYPGILERDFVLWVELWLRASRHPSLRSTASALYARMHEWFADAIGAGIAAGEFRATDVDRLTDRTLALLDGFGIRVLVDDLPIERARAEAWAVLAQELGLDPDPPARAG